MKKLRAGQALYLGVDGRHGVDHDQEASSSPTYITASRSGCRLDVPPQLLTDGAGTLTREQYLVIDDADSSFPANFRTSS